MVDTTKDIVKNPVEHLDALAAQGGEKPTSPAPVKTENTIPLEELEK